MTEYVLVNIQTILTTKKKHGKMCFSQVFFFALIILIARFVYISKCHFVVLVYDRNVEYFR